MSNLIEARRKGFEAWWEDSGMYKFKETAWAAWNAALDSVVVELPAPVSPGYHEGDDQHNITLEDCRNAIHAAGIPTKVKV